MLFHLFFGLVFSNEKIILAFNASLGSRESSETCIIIGRESSDSDGKSRIFLSKIL